MSRGSCWTAQHLGLPARPVRKTCSGRLWPHWAPAVTWFHPGIRSAQSDTMLLCGPACGLESTPMVAIHRDSTSRCSPDGILSTLYPSSPAGDQKRVGGRQVSKRLIRLGNSHPSPSLLGWASTLQKSNTNPGTQGSASIFSRPASEQSAGTTDIVLCAGCLVNITAPSCSHQAAERYARPCQYPPFLTSVHEAPAARASWPPAPGRSSTLCTAMPTGMSDSGSVLPAGKAAQDADWSAALTGRNTR